jgi:hypothetical protein
MSGKRPRARRKTAGLEHFPTFQNSHLQSFSLCCCFPLSDSSLSKVIRSLGRKIEMKETRFDSAAGAARIRVRLEHFDRSHGKKDSRSPAANDGHFHVDCSLEARFSPSYLKKEVPNTEKEVQELLEEFAAETSGKFCSEGRFCVGSA